MKKSTRAVASVFRKLPSIFASWIMRFGEISYARTAFMSKG